MTKHNVSVSFKLETCMSNISNFLAALERQNNVLKEIDDELTNLRKHDVLLRNKRTSDNSHTVEDLYRLVKTRDDVRHALRNVDAPTRSQQVRSKDEQLTKELWSEVNAVRLERQAKEIVILHLKHEFI